MLWVLKYLTDRLQFVKSGSELSNLILSKGQYCHLFFFHYTLPTAGVFMTHAWLTSLLTTQDWSWTMTTFTTDRFDRFVDWCEKNCLVLNAGKTKEMFMDFRWKKPNYKPIMIKRAVEQVDKYLLLVFIVIDKLAWHENTNEIITKVHSHLFCQRKLRSFRVHEYILQVFFLFTIISFLTFGCVCWGELIYASKQARNRPEKTTRKAWEVISRQQDTWSITDNLLTN